MIRTKIKEKSPFEEIQKILNDSKKLPVSQQIEFLNKVQSEIQKVGPFHDDPISQVLWVPLDKIKANDYNPNSVAPPEMKLLAISIRQDGYTQPVVVYKDDNSDMYEIVDGFHRSRVARECEDINARIKGYLPVTVITKKSEARNNRIAATVRHNRARGKHSIDGMSEIIIELKRRNWTDKRIARELGMEQDEILRLCQITGLYELFSDREFSKSWDVEGPIEESDFIELSDDATEFEDEETKKFRAVNTDDPNRIFHTYEKWECHKYGFYATHKDGMTKTQCEEAYRNFLSDIPRFSEALKHVILEWKHSCEQYLTNSAMNRIAWLGQAAVCFDMGIPATFRGGFFLLSEEQQLAANNCALKYLNRWLKMNGRNRITLEEAYSGDRQSDIY